MLERKKATEVDLLLDRSVSGARTLVISQVRKGASESRCIGTRRPRLLCGADLIHTGLQAGDTQSNF